MNIVIDCERMKYPNTGLYSFGDKFSNAMLKTVAEDDHLAFYIHPKTSLFVGENANYIKKKFIDKFFPVYVRNLDIWHTTYQLSKYTGGSIRSKNVLTVHDLNFLYEEDNPAIIKKFIKRHQSRIDRADHIVAISEFSKKDILEHLHIGRKPISVVHNGCSLVDYPDFDEPNYRPEKPFLFAIGTIIPKKNFHVLVPLLEGNDSELIIAGIMSGYADKIKENAKLHGVEDRVKILGPVSEEEKYWYMNNCQAFCFPSLAEGFGLPVIEAMHLGKPVFLSNLTSLPEIGGDQAYYFENFDPDHMKNVFERGMKDYKENNREAAIRQRADMFSWEQCARQYYQIYQSLLR